MRLSKGQAMTEFLLVFVVLLAATTGVWVMYQKAWKARYEKTSKPAGAFQTGSQAASEAFGVKLPGGDGYVK